MSSSQDITNIERQFDNKVWFHSLVLQGTKAFISLGLSTGCCFCRECSEALVPSSVLQIYKEKNINIGHDTYITDALLRKIENIHSDIIDNYIERHKGIQFLFDMTAKYTINNLNIRHVNLPNLLNDFLINEESNIRLINPDSDVQNETLEWLKRHKGMLLMTEISHPNKYTKIQLVKSHLNKDFYDLEQS